MSQNRFDLDLALDELKSERPDGERRVRSLGAIQRPAVRSYRKVGMVAGSIALVLIASLVVPARGNGMSWSMVQEKTGRAPHMHDVTYNSAGKLVGERWHSGTSWAVWFKDGSGRILDELRNDSKTHYIYLFRKQLTAPNAFQYAEIWNITPGMLEAEKQFSGPAQTVTQLTESRGAKVLSHFQVQVDGRRVERYVVSMYGEKTVFDADAESGLICTIRPQNGEVTQVDYPTSIDPAIFSYRSRITKDVPVLDRRGQEDVKTLPPFMPAVMASKGGIDLREVSISAYGDLYVFWTGPVPKRRLDLPGVKTGKVGWLGYYKDSLHSKSKLVCFRIELKEEVGNMVTIRFPVNGSLVEFANVKVKRLQPLKD